MEEWLEVSVRVPGEAAEAVSEVLSRYAPGGVAIDLGDENAELTQPVTVKAYVAVDDDVDAHRREIEVALAHLHHIWSVVPDPVFTRIEEQDWTAGWKARIPVLHLGEHVVIKPSWRTYTPHGDEVVLKMDPGLAFGTGLHPTTQLCVEALEDLLRPGMRVLDLGTGTGVLALVAAKLGAAEVLAVDHDVNAVAVTRRNIRANHATHKVRPMHGTLTDISGTYDLVLANLLAPIIIEMAETGLASRMRRGGVLVTSGILAEQVPEVTQALNACGLRVTDRRQRDTWVALVARKAHGVPPSVSNHRLV
jgi:ribosomal protein L11 methyltransferase